MNGRPLFATFAALLATTLAFPQAGDKKDRPGSVQREIWKEIDAPPAPLLTPEQALESFFVQPGYALELVAAEPLINDPVAITWDEDGRLWATEMWAYMPDVDGSGEDEPVSRVVVLEDLDKDGKMDRSTIFLDGLVMPRAVAIIDGGVLIADVPNLYFCEDTDGDLVCDRKTIIAEYGVEGNVEHAENGLMRGIDNWYYNAKSNRRFKFKDGKLSQEETTAKRGQWGITQDDYGRIFYNHNSTMLLGDLVPFEQTNRNPGQTPKAAFGRKIVDDQSTFTARVNLSVNRAYRENWLTENYRLKKADAASAPAIYRGNRYQKALDGYAFTPEPAGNIVAAYSLSDDGLEIKAQHILHPHDAKGPVEFIASTDERFRPVTIKTGPDGYLYIVDMYRGIIQHKTYLTSFLRKQSIERGLHQPVGYGRIYRLVKTEEKSDYSVPALSQASELELVSHLQSDNGWTRDTAQRLLAETLHLQPATIKALKDLAIANSDIPGIHALWTLREIEKLEPQTLAESLQHATPWKQTHIWRLVEKLDPTLRAKFQEALSSPSERVRLQALLRSPDLLTEAELLELVINRPESELENPIYQDAFVSILSGHERALLDRLSGQGQPQSDALAALVSDLAKALSVSNANPELLETATNQANQSWARSTFAKTVQAERERQKTSHFDNYSENEQKALLRGKATYQKACAMCHQADGQGLANLAPPLAGSPWVTESKEQLALIVAHGLEGPIEVNGTLWNSVMPPHGNHPDLQGNKLNELLSYLRAAWGNNQSLYLFNEEADYLSPHKDRATPWTAESLKAELQKSK